MILLVMLFQLILSNAKAQASGQWLKEPAELAKEFCATDWPLTSDNCTVPKAPTLVIQLPESFGHVVEMHIQQAKQAGFYQALDMDDFYHGHLIVKGPQTIFSSMEELLENTSMALYHTDEHSGHWDAERANGRSAAECTPRSLVGFPDGKLQPARDFVVPDRHLYEQSGTIYGSDIVAAIPGASELPYEGFGGIPDIFLSTNSGMCQLDSLQFYVMPRADGKFFTPEGKSLSIFIRCVENKPGGQVSYTSVKRP